MTAMTIVAETHRFVVGVDTHVRNHVYTILAGSTGVVIDTKDFPTTPAGFNRALAWVARRTEADADTLWSLMDIQWLRRHGWMPNSTT